MITYIPFHLVILILIVMFNKGLKFVLLDIFCLFNLCVVEKAIVTHLTSYR